MIVIKVLLTLIVLLQTIQMIVDDREARRKLSEFNVNPEDITSDQCTVQESMSRANHYLFNTCPTTYDPICNDPIFNKNNEFEFRCRLPMRTNSVLSMNSTGFLEMMKMRDPYARDWCMIVMFHSPSCIFSARLAPHFNAIARKFENILPIAVDASDFTKTHRLNFRYGVSGTPTVLLWVNGLGVARMGNNNLDEESLKTLITTHTDLVEKVPDVEPKDNIIPDKFMEMGAELKDVSIEVIESPLVNILVSLICFLVCTTTFIYHVRERILLSTPVLRWFQSKCGGPLCEDIYFLFYVAAPRNRGPPPPAPPAPEEPGEEVIELPQNDELPPLIIEGDE